MENKKVGRFFTKIFNVTGLYSYKIHGNMKASAGKEGCFNRRLFMNSFLDKEAKVVLANVNHGTWVAVVFSKDFSGREMIIEADALIAKNLDNLFLAVTFADCPPVFLFDPAEKIIATIHGGWRPVANGIIGKTAKKMIDLGAEAKRLKTAILPGVCWRCYEFESEKALQVFRPYWSFLKFSSSGKERGKCYVDLKGIIRYQLVKEIGISLKNLEVSSDCTCCQKDIYFSYRGEKMKSDRVQANIAMLGLKENL